MSFGNQSGQNNGGFGSNKGASGFNPSQPNSPTPFGRQSGTPFGRQQGSETKPAAFWPSTTQPANGNAGANVPAADPTSKQSGLAKGTPVQSPMQNQRPTVTVSNCIRGKVAQYSSSGKEDGTYHRLFILKLFDALIYHQRFEDVLHRFKVRIAGASDAFGNTAYRDVWVNVHGTLSGGAQIVDNSEVEVYGKFKNNIFMARRINVIDNGYTMPVTFQHSVQAILYGILAIIAAAFFIYIGVSSNGSFFENIGSFLKTWLITAVCLTVLYFILIFSRVGIVLRMGFGRPRSFPWIGILLASLVLSLIFINSFGLGASIGGMLSGLLSSALSVVIFIAAMYFVFKLLFKLF